MTDKLRLISPETFCYPVNNTDPDDKTWPFEEGDVVFVAGSRFVPYSKDDPYMMRCIFIIQKFNTEDGSLGKDFWYIDPVDLEMVDESLDKHYGELFHNYFHKMMIEMSGETSFEMSSEDDEPVSIN